MSNYPQYRDLELRGIDVVELLGGTRPLDSEEFRALVNGIEAVGGELYVDLLYLLTHRRFSPDEAQEMWRGIIEHKRGLESQLGRDPGVRLSALDYLQNVRKVIRSPRLIDRGDFEEVMNSVSTDPLTGLYNRRHLRATYQIELRRARRYSNPLTILLLDIDHFKAINDSHGHFAGDRVLVALADLLRDVCRETDTIGRHGGDEVMVLLPETKKDDAYTLAERIRRAAADREVELEGGATVHFSLSIGVSTYPDDSQEPEELLQLADEALYTSKGRGRDVVSLYEHDDRPRRQAGE